MARNEKPALESRRVRSQPLTVTVESTAARPARRSEIEGSGMAKGRLTNMPQTRESASQKDPADLSSKNLSPSSTPALTAPTRQSHPVEDNGEWEGEAPAETRSSNTQP